MARYLIKKDNVTKTITYMKYDINGYEFSPKKKSNSYIVVDHIVIINPSLIEKILARRFDKTFKRLAYSIYNLISDDDATETDTSLAMDEVKRMKEILYNKYEKFLTQEKTAEFFRKLDFLEQELRVKQMLINEMLLNMPEEEKGMGR